MGIKEAEFWFRVVIQVQVLELERLEFESWVCHLLAMDVTLVIEVMHPL